MLSKTADSDDGFHEAAWRGKVIFLWSCYYSRSSFAIPFFQIWYLPLFFDYALIPQQKRDMKGHDNLADFYGCYGFFQRDFFWSIAHFGWQEKSIRSLIVSSNYTFQGRT